MLFYSKDNYENELVWDGEKRTILCKFLKGECEIQDDRTWEILKSLGYKYKEEKKVKPVVKKRKPVVKKAKKGKKGK